MVQSDLTSEINFKQGNPLKTIVKGFPGSLFAFFPHEKICFLPLAEFHLISFPTAKELLTSPVALSGNKEFYTFRPFLISGIRPDIRFHLPDIRLAG